MNNKLWHLQHFDYDFKQESCFVFFVFFPFSLFSDLRDFFLKIHHIPVELFQIFCGLQGCAVSVCVCVCDPAASYGESTTRSLLIVKLILASVLIIYLHVNSCTTC